jgi:ribose 5-phosphate isomerase A
MGNDESKSATKTDPAEAAKRQAAQWAAGQVKEGMAVGLGSGTTAKLMIDELGRRVQAGLRIVAIATSIQSQRQAESLGIPLTDFGRQPQLDLTIDGADEVQRGTLNLIKGHGGALLREKIVAVASRRMLVTVDTRKIVDRLGSLFTVPVEIVPFGWETTWRRLRDKGFEGELRRNDDGSPYVTDGQHYIVHCRLIEGGMTPEQAAEAFKSTTGVVEHGLFLGIANQVVIGSEAGVSFLERTA